jgi:hypothetical protein
MTKTTLYVDIDTKTKKLLDKRAKKQLLTTEELVADILRRSVLSYNKGEGSDNVEDKFLTFFSRKKRKNKG